MTIGLDWDGTIDRYFKALGLLSKCADKVIIVTLNTSITEEIANEYLGVEVDDIIIMQDDEFDTSMDIFLNIAEWKFKVCEEHNIDLLIDDDDDIIKYFFRNGVPAIKCDGEFEYE